MVTNYFNRGICPHPHGHGYLMINCDIVLLTTQSKLLVFWDVTNRDPNWHIAPSYHGRSQLGVLEFAPPISNPNYT